MRTNTILLAFLCLANLAHACRYECNDEEADVNAVVSIGFVGAVYPGFNNSITFPIEDPIVDSFYIYESPSTDTQVEPGINVFIGGEWPLTPLLSLQVGVDFIQTAAVNIEGTVTQGADVPSENIYAYEYSILTQQFLLLTKLLFNVQEVYHPYFLLGLGGGYVEARDFTTDVPPYLTYTREYEDNTSGHFSYALGLGLDVDLIYGLRAGFGYRFTGMGSSELGPATIDGTEVSGTLTQDSFNLNEFLVQLSWVF